MADIQRGLWGFNYYQIDNKVLTDLLTLFREGICSYINKAPVGGLVPTFLYSFRTLHLNSTIGIVS